MNDDKETPTNVVEIKKYTKKKVEEVFEHRCGAQMFFLHRGGEIECHSCHSIMMNMTWAETDPEPAKR
jgi:hypothetical protein